MSDGAWPLVVTLLLEPAAQQRFQALRQAHFPPERLVVGAHVTLFHALPGEHEQQVRDDLQQAAASPAFPLLVSRVRSLGRGVAFDLTAPAVDRLRTDLAERWRPWLTRQDAGAFGAHVTVQNKVSAQRARDTLAQLRAEFVPYDVPAAGLALWRYVGGPWEPLQEWPFRG